jgi:hypothetical protein
MTEVVAAKMITSVCSNPDIKDAIINGRTLKRMVEGIYKTVGSKRIGELKEKCIIICTKQKKSGQVKIGPKNKITEIVCFYLDENDDVKQKVWWNKSDSWATNQRALYQKVSAFSELKFGEKVKLKDSTVPFN